MAVKIEKKIVAYHVKGDEDKAADIVESSAKKEAEAGTAKAPKAEQLQLDGGGPDSDQSATIVRMHEKVERPDMLIGSTYKIKTPVSEHAFYITINDMVLNPDTPYEKRRPFEVFINSKNMDHYQWISALTLIISAVFRKGGDVTFLVKELRSVFDPKGGYFKRGGKFMPSLVAEIGDAIETHMKLIGLIKDDSMDDHQRQLVEEKRREYEGRNKKAVEDEESSFPAGATLCSKCSTKAMIMMDGCLTCLNCGESKCG
jgi:hypothetical protein